MLLLTILLVAVGACGLFGIHLTNEGLEDASGNVPTAIAIAQQQEALARARLGLDRLVGQHDSAGSDELVGKVQQLMVESDSAWARYLAFPADDDEKRLASAVAKRRDELKSSGLGPLVTAVKNRDGNAEESLAFEQIPRLYAAFSTAVSDLEQYQVSNAMQLVKEGESREQRTLLIVAIASVFGVVSILFAWRVLGQAINVPLEHAVEHFEAIERGDLNRDVQIKRNDELGALLNGLRKMQQGLRVTVLTVRSGVEAVAGAAGEIAAGNDDLSRRTEQQAASLEETAASMEQLTVTVKNNASNATKAQDLSRTVSDKASMGADSVYRLSTTMNALKEQSTKIAEISDIIDGIAFQTNILALNAAVEAARAGEQGRGFSVVAAEVRSLAQRSGIAAKEIKGLISASVAKVGEGALRATEATERMNETMDGIGKVATLISEIADASQEQARGIEQVNTAVAHMDEVTQQNAALVEQAAAASSTLNEQAGKIREVVAIFQTGEVSA